MSSVSPIIAIWSLQRSRVLRTGSHRDLPESGAAWPSPSALPDELQPSAVQDLHSSSSTFPGPASLPQKTARPTGN